MLFSELSLLIKYKLFHSYCMSLYGGELWLLSNDQINDLCVSWRKSLRRIWGLLFIYHCYLLPLLSQCLPLLDEICRRSLCFKLKFIEVYICNGSSLVRAVTNYGIQYGRHNSLLGYNLLFCAQLYNSSAQYIISGKVNRFVNYCMYKLVKDYQLQTASFVLEIVLIREGTLELSNRVSLSRLELE